MEAVNVVGSKFSSAEKTGRDSWCPHRLEVQSLARALVEDVKLSRRSRQEAALHSYLKPNAPATLNTLQLF